MIWLSWRQFRAQAAVVAGALVIFAVIVIVTGTHLETLYHACKAVHTCGSNGFGSTDDKLQVVLQAIVLLAPALLGAFWGAPLIARELEAGTFRLAWTQSVSRQRWLAVKLGMAGLASVATVGLLSLLVTWWFSPIDTVLANRFSTFDFRNIAPLGYAVFAFALGVTAGVLIRRTVPAMATTLVGFVAARVAVYEWVRAHLLPSLHRVVPISTSNGSFGIVRTSSGVSLMVGPPSIPNAWVYSGTLVAKSGHASSTTFFNKNCSGLLHSLPSPPRSSSGGILGGHSAVVSRSPGPGQDAFRSCFVKVAAHFNEVVVYQPSSHYWPLQGMETALFVVVSAALLGLTYWWVRHRIS